MGATATVSVPSLWPGETIVLLGCGPSLAASDVDYVRGKARVIAINTAYELAPWADVLYACDARWWAHHRGAKLCAGLKYSIEAASSKWQGVQILKNTGNDGLEFNSAGLRTGKNSGYQAINLAVHLGAVRILLLGYDMKTVKGQDHFSQNYPARSTSPYTLFLRHFETIVAPLKAQGVEVVNCTPGSSLKCFPRQLLREALPDQASAVVVSELTEASL